MKPQNVWTGIIRFCTTGLRGRPHIRVGVSLVAAVMGIFLVSGCGGNGPNATTAAGGRTLDTAFSADPSTADPDTFYEAEGVLLTNSTYQTLLTVAPNSNTLEPLLATKWSESPDGLTYTFTLRQGVRFDDGTPFNSVAAKDSLERRGELQGGPSYMVADIKSMDTPSPYELVIHMMHPHSPFLTYLASPFGPMMESPTAIKDHQVHGDHASHWLATHTAGTGPYFLSSMVPNVRYVLSTNPYYWGPKPYFTTVKISVLPDFATQQLEILNGQLTAVMHGLTTQAYDSMRHNPAVEVETFPTLLDTVLDVNPASKVFDSATVRAALREALNNKTLTQQAFGQDAVPSTNFYPSGMLPNGAVPDGTVYNPSLLASALVRYKGMKVTVGWSTDVADQLVANITAAILQKDGLNASVEDIPPPSVYNLPTTPRDRPDLFVTDMNPDSISPDTWARIYDYKNGAVNWEGASVPAADKVLDQAVLATNPATALKLEIEAATLYRNSNYFDPISDDYDTMVFRAGITGFHSLITYQYVINLADLRR